MRTFFRILLLLIATFLVTCVSPEIVVWAIPATASFDYLLITCLSVRIVGAILFITLVTISAIRAHDLKKLNTELSNSLNDLIEINKAKSVERDANWHFVIMKPGYKKQDIDLVRKKLHDGLSNAIIRLENEVKFDFARAKDMCADYKDDEYTMSMNVANLVAGPCYGFEIMSFDAEQTAMELKELVGADLKVINGKRFLPSDGTIRRDLISLRRRKFDKVNNLVECYSGPKAVEKMKQFKMQALANAEDAKNDVYKKMGLGYNNK